MTEQFEVDNQDSLTMVGFFPHEIIAILDGWTTQIPVDLSRPVREPVELIQQLEIMRGVVDYIESRQNSGHTTVTCTQLTEEQHAYLAYWILNSRRAAYRLLESQPDIRLGVENHPRALISNTLMASWFNPAKDKRDNS